MIHHCPKTGYMVFVKSEAVPDGFKAIVDGCLRDYGYAFFGRESVLHSQVKGSFFSLYFKGKDGAFHCLPHSDKGCNQLARTAAGLAPLFAW